MRGGKEEGGREAVEGGGRGKEILECGVSEVTRAPNLREETVTLP